MSFAHFTVSYHRTKEKENSHIDLFLSGSVDELLVQYQCSVEELRKAKKEKRSPVCTLGTPHRRKYLEYSGPIRGDRGRVRVLKRGKCKVPDQMFENPPRTIRLAKFLSL